VDNYVSGSPVVDGDVVYAATGAGTLFALQSDDGTERWRFESGTHMATPSVADETIYAGADVVYAIDATTGNSKWTFDTTGTANAGPLAVTDGAVYASGSELGEPSTVYALDRRR
jgi:serine/threonine-protein kinase